MDGRIRGSAGFTLVEMVMSLVILAAISSVGLIFLKPAIDGYFGARVRSDLSAQANAAVRLMARDVRSSVPNSVRTPSNQCFETIPTSTGGAYRSGPDTVNDSGPNCSPSATCSAPLDTSRSTSAFDVLSPLQVVPAVGDAVVVGNQNTADVYAGTDRAAITGVSTPRPTDGSLRLTIAPTQFPLGYSGGRFVVVPAAQQAVFYVCTGADGTLNAAGQGKGTLYRLQGYGYNAAAPAACPSTLGAEVVATKVRSCNFVYSPVQGGTQQNALVSLEISVADNNETVTLNHGAHIDNSP